MSSGHHLIHSISRIQAQTADHCGRRAFVKGMAALAGAAGLSAYDMKRAAAEPAPETTKLRMVTSPALCFAPQYIADALLRAEGFIDVEYIQASDTPTMRVVATGDGDFTIDAVRSAIMSVDAGDPLVLLSGVHLGCYELFGTERVRTIKDLRGSRVAGIHNGQRSASLPCQHGSLRRAQSGTGH
jgi:NitT/TauT family transport system substrate-binding protein